MFSPSPAILTSLAVAGQGYRSSSLLLLRLRAHMFPVNVQPCTAPQFPRLQGNLLNWAGSGPGAIEEHGRRKGGDWQSCWCFFYTNEMGVWPLSSTEQNINSQREFSTPRGTTAAKGTFPTPCHKGARLVPPASWWSAWWLCPVSLKVLKHLTSLLQTRSRRDPGLCPCAHPGTFLHALAREAIKFLTIQWHQWRSMAAQDPACGTLTL